MNSEQNEMNNLNEVFIDEAGNPVETQYVDEAGNPIDPSLIDEFGNYIGEQVTQYVDEFGNPIDPSLIDEFGNYIGEMQYVDEAGNPVSNSVQTNSINENAIAASLNKASELTNTSKTISASEHQMDDKELLTGMVTFDYNNVPITDIVNSIILDAINKGASDIHFDPFEEGIKIRVRIDGQLNDYSIVPLFVKKNMITRIKIISGMNITESRIPQDGAIRTELQNKTVDLRVSCLPTNVGEKIVIRIMDYSMSAAGFEALDFSDVNLEKVNKMLSLPNGIILVTGATGTGKSTTVYSMLQKLNVEGTNIVTVEDPIEMNIGGINQVQAASEIGLNFATVLRSILRQDPDVIMIGEIRDDETARIAVRASITGHLVLSTIHTNNSLSTIERLTDMSVERYLLGSALSGIVSQKLSRRLCEKCKRQRETTEYEKEIFKKVLNKDIEKIYEPVGCPECSRGYRGRIAIHEVLLLNQNIKDAITKGVQKSTLRKLVYGNNGTDTMLQDGLEKVLQGKTSFEEILKLIDLEDDLGSGSQLGLEDQIDASSMNNQTNQPININITPDILNVLGMQNSNIKSPISNTKDIVNENIIEENKAKSEDTELQENIDKLNTLLKKLYDTKKIINKKRFSIRVNNILNDIKPLLNTIKKLNNNFELDNILENEIKDLLNSIVLNIKTLKNTTEISLYQNTIQNIIDVLGIKNADIYLNDDEFVEETINEIQESQKQEEIDNVLIEIEDEIIPISLDNKPDINIPIIETDDVEILELNDNNEIETINETTNETLEEIVNDLEPITLDKPIMDIQITEKDDEDNEAYNDFDVIESENAVDDIIIDNLLTDLDDIIE